MRITTWRKSLVLLATGAWLLGSVDCLPTSDELRAIVQADILSLFSAGLETVFGAVVQQVTSGT